MNAALVKLAAGEMRFDEFARRTDREWRAMARRLMQRWNGPTTVTEDDLVQEMLLAAWRLVPQHDPARASLQRFIVWNSVGEAKRWLHRQRHAKSLSDCSPSRHATPLPNTADKNATESWGFHPQLTRTGCPSLERIATVRPDQEERAQYAEALTRLVGSLAPEERPAWQALDRTRCPERAAVLLHAAGEVETLTEARRRVRSVMLRAHAATAP